MLGLRYWIEAKRAQTIWNHNAGQKFWQKLGNQAELNTILDILLSSNIIPLFPPPPPPPTPPSPNINVEVVAHPQTNTSRTTLNLGEGVVLKSHPFYSKINSLMFLPNYFVRHCMWLRLSKNIISSIKNQFPHFDSALNVDENGQRTVMIWCVLAEVSNLKVP